MNAFPFVVAGVNHRTAPLELRERLAFAASDLPEAMFALRSMPDLLEGMVLSTCNRVEVLVSCNGKEPDIVEFLARHASVPATELQEHLYLYRGEHAVRHVFRVASSLDSMVVGESQILGQLKEAYGLGRDCGAVQARLDALLTRAFSVAKRVRTETEIGSSSVSVASTAVELAKRIFGSLEGRTVMVVGGGKMIELALRHLREAGVVEVYVINRTYERANELARQFNGKAIAFDSLADAAPLADIVITSTGSQKPIFCRENGEQFMHRRRNRPMFFIDIAVPRDVAPDMNKVEGVFVYDIDDLQQVIASNKAGRDLAAKKAEQIIDAEVERFRERLRELHVVPTILSLQDSMEMLRQSEIERVRPRLGQLTPEQEQALESLTRGIINKVLHTPITALKTAAKSQTADAMVQHVERLFGIAQKQRDGRDEDDSKA